MLARHARVHRPAQPIRVLSPPCSTGEEAYSFAMAMFDAGFEAHELKIDGVDVSSRNVATAKRAIYGRNSFSREPSLRTLPLQLASNAIMVARRSLLVEGRR